MMQYLYGWKHKLQTDDEKVLEHASIKSIGTELVGGGGGDCNVPAIKIMETGKGKEISAKKDH